MDKLAQTAAVSTPASQFHIFHFFSTFFAFQKHISWIQGHHNRTLTRIISKIERHIIGKTLATDSTAKPSQSAPAAAAVALTWQKQSK